MNTKLFNIADLIDPTDSQGRTYRQVNNSKMHAIPLGVLVEERETGVRLFTAKHTRDCDGTPLYSLSAYQGEESQQRHVMYHGYDDSLAVVANPTTPPPESQTPPP